MAPPIKFTPLIFKEIATEILFKFNSIKEKNQYSFTNEDKFAIYSLAIHLRDGAANAIANVLNRVKTELSRYYTIIAEHQFVEWWYTQIKYWDIKFTNDSEYPEPLIFEELLKNFPTISLTAEYHLFINKIKEHIYNTYKKHICSKFDDDTIWQNFRQKDY